MLQGKNAVVTGARTGIGRATVEKFAEFGANIWACARQPDAAFESDMKNISHRYGIWIETVFFDFADKSQIEAGAKEILSAKRPVDILVNNAAINQTELFMKASIDNIEHLFAVDFFGPLLFTQKLAKRMMRGKASSIVNISSLRGLQPAPGRLAYSSAKSALKTATETLALELASSGVRVNAVAPGQIGSERMMEELKERKTSINNALGRFGTSAEVAEVILFLASDMSSYMTGETIPVTGGRGTDFTSS
ncbi:SDR family NAD(P)-dependent oxidoreductase [Pseudooceanicola atlanticus]|uniref:SDR family NAD(P)-dependent oxidoreductase n=1 Tax=Pseudooceanicola atlanticus TaxID=1461694 RepID=UPI0009DCBEB3|nr:SDR family oxidoreductase [Pseudooceanicola atlanticus]